MTSERNNATASRPSQPDFAASLKQAVMTAGGWLHFNWDFNARVDGTVATIEVTCRCTCHAPERYFIKSEEHGPIHRRVTLGEWALITDDTPEGIAHAALQLVGEARR